MKKKQLYAERLSFPLSKNVDIKYVFQLLLQ